MSYLAERVAYLRGLSEGLSISDQSAEGKLLLKIIEVLEDVSDSIDTLEEAQQELDEYVENMDDDLAEVEEELFGEEDEDDDFLEIECPHCHEVIYFDQDALAGDTLICPVCNQAILPEEDDGEDE